MRAQVVSLQLGHPLRPDEMAWRVRNVSCAEVWRPCLVGNITNVFRKDFKWYPTKRLQCCSFSFYINLYVEYLNVQNVISVFLPLDFL